ncbi:MAG TPA: magnesium transporter CorA family protein [Rhizomicrobium sp.]|jgi:magnesium transporter|nr:magnesium transporter CorA family protein [Rhizomicrobium sp.]
MLQTYPDVGDTLANAVWIDLFNPTEEEIKKVGSALNIRLPSRDDLEEIESSSRLQSSDNQLRLSMPIVAHGEDDLPTPLGMVLTNDYLVTIRYADMHSYVEVREAIAKSGNCTSSQVFSAMVDAMVDFSADVLERTSEALNQISRDSFRRYASKRAHNVARANKRLRETLVALGAAGEQMSQIRDSILGLQRITSFSIDKGAKWIEPDTLVRLKTAGGDLQSLADFEVHLSNKVQFLLDAVLGFINTEQNDIFKVLTIVSVVGIPPTLIASMYGMNFQFTPEYHWHYGYPFGLLLIALSAILPTIWFKWRGWW